MSDLHSTYQQILERIEDFLKKGNEELTEETKKRLTTLREMSEILATILAEKGQVKEEASEVNQYIVLIVKICGTVLFGPYTEFLTQLCDRSKMVNEMENKQREDNSGALPRFMQVKYDQVKSYLGKANGRLKEIDNMLSELVPKVRKARKEKFKIPDEEITDLEMDIEDVNGELEKCKNYLTEAENVLSMLEADIVSETRKFGVKVVGAAAGVAAVAIVGGATFAYNKREEVGQFLGRVGTVPAGMLGAAGALGVAAISIKLWSIIDEHKTSYRQYVDTLKMELHGLQTEYRNMEGEIKKKLTDRMKGKN